MTLKIARPLNPYSNDWILYNNQNPALHRSVGADGDNDGGGDEVTVESLQAQMATDKTAYESSLSQVTTLTEELDKWKAKQSEAEKHRKEQEKAAAKAVEEAARKSGDVDALEKSWGEKYNTDIGELKKQNEEQSKLLNDSTVGNAALLMATNMASKPEYVPVLQRYLTDDLYMDVIEGVATVKVSQGGKPSALTLDDLGSKTSNLPMFAGMVIGSYASGGGIKPGGSGGGQGGKIVSRSDFNSMSQFERQKVIKDKVKIVDD